MTDREMLELAAKAAGIDGLHLGSQGAQWWIGKTGRTWNPLTDDGDALRLAVRLHIGVRSNGPTYWMEPNTSIAIYDDRESGGRILVRHGDDPEHSTRRAIVRAAAEIGAQL